MSPKSSFIPFVFLAGALVVVMASSCAREPGMARGEEVFDTCVPCHGEDGGGDAKLGAPAIAGMDQWYLQEQLTKFKTGIRGKHPEDIEGHRMRPMARTLYKEGDVESVAQYVAGLPVVPPQHLLTGGNAALGESTYVVCSACHGAALEGNEPLRAPPLRAQSDWYMLSQLKKYKNGMRGTDPSDAFGGVMRAQASVLASEEDMMNVIAYVRTLQKNGGGD